MRDRYGIVPPHIKQNYEREEMVDRHIAAATQLLAALRGIDERLDVVFVSDRADPEYGVMPGRWHVVRKNPPPAPDSYIPIVTESGGYRPPDSGVLEEMRKRDLWKESNRPSFDETPAMHKEPKGMDEGMIEELAADIRAGQRVAGDGGLYARKWGRGASKKVKGVVG